MAGERENLGKRRDSDPETLVKGLEAELIFKRAAWQRAAVRRRSWRSLSFLFLFVVVLGALFAYFYLLPQLSRRGADAPAAAAKSTR
jgi:hypothetical protein